MIEQNTRESAIRREEFHELLRNWLDDTFDNVAGDGDGHSGPAWLWVRHGGAHYYLTAATTRAGVREYLRVSEVERGDPEWSLQSDQQGVRDRVTVGRDRRIIDGFEFYHHVPGR